MASGELAGKLVLVTGGAKNVGKAIARRFAERGAHVIINFFHSLDASKKAAEELRGLGVKVDTIRASVAQKHQVDRMFDEIEAKYGRLDILVNNAASGALLGIEDITEEHLDRAIDTNLKGAFWCSRRAAALMTKSGGGTIVNVSSAGASLVPANYLVVGTSKAALESLTRYLAVEYAPRNIRVNTASATLIDGDVAGMFPDPENTKRSSIAGTPMKRLATPEDLADLVVFLATEQSRWITGQVVLADGGLSLCNEALSPRKGWREQSLPRAVQTNLEPAKSTLDTTPGAAEDAPPVAQDADDLDDSIAIVGMGLALPGANNPEEFWRTLMEGPELFSNVPSERWDYHSFYAKDPSVTDKSYQTRSVFITDFKAVPRLQAEIDAGTAPQELTTLWLRHALMQAMEGVTMRADDRASFLVGYTADGSQHLEEAMVLAGARARMEAVLEAGNASAEERERCLAQIDATLCARYARGASGLEEVFPHRVGINAMKGVLPEKSEYVMVDTACSSSLYSIDLGIKALMLGKQDVIACGGAFALAPRASVLFSKLHGLSKRGEVRPLDKDCDGVLFSDGAGVVILKRLKRALADGDKVLAVIKAFGSSSDGKGKAIYAPNSAGQSIAIRRAYEQPGASLAHVDWVVAHATGTPAGDLAEFQSLREMIVSDHPVQLTSNKSLVGHTGWAAGVTSLIQVLLGLQHGCIPPQHRFTQAPAEFGIEECCLTIPTKPVPWARKPGTPRVAAVSGFGFGGTNGHLVVAEYRPDVPVVAPRKPDAKEPLVIVGWSAKFPGLDGADAIRAWITGNGPAPATSFGEVYPLPPLQRLRMPPAVLRALDRCQLMAVDAAHDMHEQFREFWDAHANTIGVVMGHMGPTRNAALYASRCYLDDMEIALKDRMAGSPEVTAAVAGMRKETERLVAASTENSFPGMMPNVIPARVANYYDLHGLNITLDAGHASTLAAFEAAGSYLRCGDLDMVLVGGINGNTAAEIRPAFAATVAEGLVLFAVMTEAGAQAAGLPVLAHFESLTSSVPAGSAAVPSMKDGDRSYMGADGAVAVLQAILGQNASSVVEIGNEHDAGKFAVEIKTKAAPSAVPAMPFQQKHDPSPVKIPDHIRNVELCADGQAPGVQRYRIALEDTPWVPGAPPVAFLPADCLLVTDAPELLETLGQLPADLLVLSLRPLQQSRPGWHHVADLSETTIAETIQAAPRHVRVLGSLHASELPDGRLAAPAPALLALHTLAFLALKHCYASLANGGTFLTLFLDAIYKDILHPDAGLFSGMVKAMGVEMPACRPLAVFTDSRDARIGIAQAQHESGGRQLLPVVALCGTRRMTPRVTPSAGVFPSNGLARLGPGSVVVAFGGARGITAELMKAVAAEFRPTLYLIGSSRLDDDSLQSFTGSDEEFARSRAQYIRDQRARDPGLALPCINKMFDRLIEARAAQRNIETMKAHCGAGKVHYLTADIVDADSVQRAVAQILVREAQVDLVVNAPGLSRSASVQIKSLADFIAVRDIKVRGYWNLRAAFGVRQPRAWCNFGSFIGLTGQAGETDYAAANDFLNTQAAYHRAALGDDEFTIGWTLWQSVGLGSNPVTRAFLEKSGLFTSMRTEEGVHHFLREINLEQPDTASVHLGVAERAAIERHLPGFFAPSAPARAGFYLDRELTRDETSVLFERVFDLDRDAYLLHHKVNGFATLPGTFVPEISAEAALQLAPGMKVVGFEDVVFHHFLRVYDARKPSVKKIHAKVLRRDGELMIVQVLVTGDVTAPGGQVLVRDKLHFEIKVLLAPAYERAPIWAHRPNTPYTPVADPYHFDAAPVLLTRMFVSTIDTGMNADGKRARFKLDVPQDDPVFSRFVIPSILLDGLARVAALNHIAENYIPLAAPASIRRIDIYEAGNDCELTNRYGNDIALYATPGKFSLEDPNARNRFVAARPDGQIIMQMKDVTGVVIGYVHRVTGAFVPKEEVDSLVAQRGALEGVEA